MAPNPCVLFDDGNCFLFMMKKIIKRDENALKISCSPFGMRNGEMGTLEI